MRYIMFVLLKIQPLRWWLPIRLWRCLRVNINLIENSIIVLPWFGSLMFFHATEIHMEAMESKTQDDPFFRSTWSPSRIACSFISSCLFIDKNKPSFVIKPKSLVPSTKKYTRLKIQNSLCFVQPHLKIFWYRSVYMQSSSYKFLLFALQLRCETGETGIKEGPSHLYLTHSPILNSLHF